MVKRIRFVAIFGIHAPVCAIVQRHRSLDFRRQIFQARFRLATCRWVGQICKSCLCNTKSALVGGALRCGRAHQ